MKLRWLNLVACVAVAVAPCVAGCGQQPPAEPPKGAPTEKEVENLQDGLKIDLGEPKDDENSP